MKKRLFCLFILVAAAASQAAPSDIAITEGAGNPVLLQTSVGAGRYYYAHVLYDPFAGKYRAWADASSSNDITYAESTGDNPAAWSGYTLCTGTLGPRGKAHVVQLGANSFRMWHTGDDGTPGYEVHTFTGSNGIDWSNATPITGVADTGDSIPTADGPFEHFCPAGNGAGFVCLANTREGSAEQTGRELNWYSSADGITWTFEHGTGILGYDISTLVRHPDRANTWYAYGYQQGGEDFIVSLYSTDNGATWQMDQEPVPVIGVAGEFPYNPNRNYNPQAIYRGSGNWVFFRTTSDSSASPAHRTSYSTGIESGLTFSSIENWMLMER